MDILKCRNKSVRFDHVLKMFRLYKRLYPKHRSQSDNKYKKDGPEFTKTKTSWTETNTAGQDPTKPFPKQTRKKISYTVIILFSKLIA